ncbi:S-layer homology domain-containing protein [Bacillus sp. ISL-47]|uniref:S-layer homology domain-containing protein n=1 Tax=Bacillus sp. ISL-47 TaxID=2819130 RepID=UPI001BEA3797|nr:S-layer homology domain-containing protein [Bacillus sp. ISL-47]MBT2687433.1 S-layer homology domain-containing protein [Bacillus sp. ISL-47]MBT2707105.1 S-layer homology domain-containing protein [Pseudomonas sp. ISL-84]
MKKFRKAIMAFTILGSLTLFSQTDAEAADQISNKCNYVSKPGVNPDLKTMNCLLTETALSNDVPPEIVKAIAEGESGDWKQFDSSGNPVITDDNGIGVMQVTNQSNYSEERLKADVVYNIQAGIEILDQMFKRSDLPKINGGERDVLEHWYFAIMAYNGTKPVNSPIIQATGERNTEAYQEKIIRIIEKLGLIQLTELPFSTQDFEYNSSSSENIKFNTKHYQFDLPFTKTKHQFITGQIAETTTAVNLRSEPTTDSTSNGTLTKGERVTIQGHFEYEQVPARKNHFVWYPVKRSDGSTGYVASSYLDFRFIDVPGGHYAEEEIYYLADRNILRGVSYNSFGLKQNLTRWQAVLLLVRANNVSLEDRPDPGFSDVPKSYPYYSEISAAVDEGIFAGKSKTAFKPDDKLTRSEMAVLLQRLYSFPETASQHPFTDVKSNAWYTDSINRMYNAGITGGITETKFGPSATVTREQFAVFLTRAVNPSYRLK